MALMVAAMGPCLWCQQVWMLVATEPSLWGVCVWLHWQPTGNSSWQRLHHACCNYFPVPGGLTPHPPVFDKCRLLGFAENCRRCSARSSPFQLSLLEGWEMLDRRVMACCLRLTWCCSQGTLASPTCLRAGGGRAASCGRTVSFWRWPALKEPGSELLP